MPDGCPRKVDPLNIADELAKKGITMYSVGCEPSIRPFKDFFSALAYKTGGVYVPLADSKLLAGVIVSGTREALSLESVMNEVFVEVNQMKQKYGNEEALSQAVHVMMVQKSKFIFKKLLRF